MAFCVPYRFVRLTTDYEADDGAVLFHDYYGIEVNGNFLVKQEDDHALYQAQVSQVDDYSTDDNWFTISGCRGLQVAENIDNSWSAFVDQVFDQIRKELSFK